MTFARITVGLALLAGAGCGGEDPTARPESSRTVVSDEDVARFEAAGVPVHRGLSPPDVRGTYLHDSVSRLGAAAAGPICGMQQALGLDGPLTVRRVVTFNGSRCPAAEDDHGLFISGSGECFTVYRRTQDATDGCAATTVNVISACLKPTGLVDYRDAFSDVTHDGPACASMVDHGRLMPIGGMVVVTEKDGLAARLD
jgi:hypothetical protein